jgi:hypothetical protein
MLRRCKTACFSGVQLSDELSARRMRKTKDAGHGARFADLVPSFMLTLSERDLSPRTHEAYAHRGSVHQVPR